MLTSAGVRSLRGAVHLLVARFIPHFASQAPPSLLSPRPSTPSKTMAGRVAQSATKRWLGDKGTWPVLVTCVAAAGLCTAQCVRYLAGHPDVNWSKQNRQDMFRYKEDVGADWQSHRRKIATIHKNVVNEAKGLNN
ncbi:hypothetical protein PF006_g1365 [Phytophthora fragariae]|uniref:Uncharacterized protein n=1 Tax=Phytophthora fragariae TaxID=53985 RepID=A0A6A3URZ8_9STRA|nr:hypothetical protein PF009_g1704 [Phytophthora fragariae]KAE9154619.1 hypothetical protein PF006_g1365 [Phytophthora fragariae]